MNTTPNHRRAIACAVTLACAAMAAAHAAHAEDAAELPKITVEAQAPAVPRNLPASTEGVTAKQIAETSNTVTAAETIQYLPSVHVRQRYIGDRNSIIAMRTNSSISSAQTILYADNLLLSNYTDNSFGTPPRWAMVSPEEIDRVDVIYGPFSALYSGNSMSGVVLMTTRMPTKFELHAKADYFTERFKLYGTQNNFDGMHGSLSVGNKFGDWSVWVSGDHLDSRSHPMTFQNAVAAAAGASVVRGGFRDRDQTGAERVITGAGQIDHTVQDNGKIKLAYDFTSWLRATYVFGVWQNKSDQTVDSFLTDANGRKIYNASSIMTDVKSIKIDGRNYTLSSNTARYNESEHFMHGLTLASNTGGRWDFEAVASVYDYGTEKTRQAAPTSAFDDGYAAKRSGGTLTDDGNTGWQTFDVRGDFRPGGDLKSEHQLSFGAHYDRYILSDYIYNVTDWLASGGGTLSQDSLGKTRTYALYLQDAWRFAPDWKLTVGGREEFWRAYDGSSYNVANTAPTPKNVVFAERKISAFSPKVALSFQATNDWLLRGAFGKAYRFPTVKEMFQSFTLPSGIKFNDPNLKPEQVKSGELASDYALSNGLWRTSLFWEDKYDALISQTDTVSDPSGKPITSIQNVDKIRTRGVETALQLTDFLTRGFDLSGSVTYTHSVIQRNNRNPSVVGRYQPRIPDWRATMVASYRFNDALTWSVAGRYSGRQWVNLQYVDLYTDRYGTVVSNYTVFDTKLAYKFAPHWTGSLGVNNLGNYKYYVNPNPYPQRTYFASLKYDI